MRAMSQERWRRWLATMRALGRPVWLAVVRRYHRYGMWGYDVGFRVLSPRMRHLLGIRCPWCGGSRVVVQGRCMICVSCSRVLALAEVE